MSGGRFDYKQYDIGYIADSIQSVIDKNHVKHEKRDECESEYYFDFDDDIIERFKTAIKLLRQSQIYAHRIDWLLSGDDGDDSFRKRLEDDLDKLCK